MPTKTRRIVFTLVLTASSLGLDARSQSRDQRLPSHEVFKHEALLRPFLEVLADIRTRYVLTYYPADVPPDGWHALTVRVKRLGLSVQAREGYYAEK